jgi:hypothetical protein
MVGEGVGAGGGVGRLGFEVGAKSCTAVAEAVCAGVSEGGAIAIGVDVAIGPHPLSASKINNGTRILSNISIRLIRILQ